MPPEIGFLVLAGVLGSLLLFGLLLRGIFDHITRPLRKDVERLKERVRQLETAERQQQDDGAETAGKAPQPQEAGTRKPP